MRGDRTRLLWNELIEGVGDKDPSDIQVQPSLLIVVVVHHPIGEVGGHKQDASELHITLALEMDMCQRITAILH